MTCLIAVQELARLLQLGIEMWVKSATPGSQLAPLNGLVESILSQQDS